jgi:hypothetical protein
MFKTLFSSLFAVSMFALGAIGSWYLSTIGLGKTEEAADTATKSVSASPASPLGLSVGESSVDLTKMPIPAHGKGMGPEELFRFAEENRRSLEDLAGQKQLLAKEANRVNLQHKDLDNKRQELDGLLLQNKDLLTEVERIENQVNQKMAELKQLQEERDKQQKKDAETGTGASEDVQANIKSMAKFLAAITPEAAGQTLKKLANDGKMDTVLSLLNNLPERDAGKILTAMGDAVLLADIMERFQHFKRPAKNIKR